MNNEPYIWMDDLGTTIGNDAYKELDDNLKDGLFALYTHPADLTDEKIIAIGYQFGELDLNIEMIRAILKKASER
jgi:hypothetical protein